MNIRTELSDDQTFIISISGIFNFALLNAFRQAYANPSGKVRSYIIDMKNVSTIDSSALGMLLYMKRALNCEDRTIRIINCNTIVKSIFQITHFDKKFLIE